MHRPQRVLKVLKLAAAPLALLVLVCYGTWLGSYLADAAARDSRPVLRQDECNQNSVIGKDTRLPTVCRNLTCREDYVKQLQRVHGRSRGCFPIPAVRHLQWRSEFVSAYFVKQLRTWLKVHPNWTVVLWRDHELRELVKKHFPAAFHRFLKLASHPIMQVDFARYMLLYKYGGVYADLDYSLLSSLDEYRRFHAVVTREPEAHSLLYFGPSWPLKVMANPAFLMSVPGHSLYRHCIERLQTRPYIKGQPLSFAGPFGLTQLLEEYEGKFPIANSPMETVYIPPSYSFHPYEQNRLNTSTSLYVPMRIGGLRALCRRMKPDWATQLQRYCRDINNMDPITDKSQPVVAVHDMTKSGSVYDGRGAKFYFKDVQNIKALLGKSLQFGSDWV